MTEQQERAALALATLTDWLDLANSSLTPAEQAVIGEAQSVLRLHAIDG